MAMIFALSEAAAQYGLVYPFDPNVIGSVTSGYWQGDPRIGYPRTFYLDTSNGFRWAVDTVPLDDKNATVTGIYLLHGDTYVWSAYGSAAATYPQFDLSVIFGGDDTFTGNSSANIFAADAGNDTVDGGAGTDEVFYALNSSQATVTRTDTGLAVTSALGTDTLKNIERIAFADKSIAYDVSGTAGQAYRLYQAALDRVPDPAGLGYYIDKLDRGMAEHDIATGFIHSPEFQSRYGATITDQQYVQLLYQNVLHRDGEADGIAFHLNELKIGLDREQLLVNFSESPENKANLLGAMENGMVYWPAI